MRTVYPTSLAVALAAFTIVAPSALAAPAAATARYDVPHPFVPGETLATYADLVNEVAPLHVQNTHPHVKGSYMVVLKKGISTSTFLAHRALISAAQFQANAARGPDADEAEGIGHIYDLEAHLQGYAGKFTDDVVDYIRSLPEVDFVEQDSIVTTLEMPYNADMIWDAGYPISTADDVSGDAHAESSQEVEKGAPWVSRKPLDISSSMAGFATHHPDAS